MYYFFSSIHAIQNIEWLVICGQLDLDTREIKTRASVCNKKQGHDKTYVTVELKVVGDAVGASAVDILGDNKGLALDRALPLCILRPVLNLGCLCRRQTQR